MGKKIAICAGHGGSNSTPGKRTPDNEYEWNFNHIVVKAAVKHLRYNGFDILRTDDETGKTDVSLASRVKRANDFKADIYISVHHNANLSKWGNWTGTETFTYGSGKSLELGKKIHTRLVKAYGLRDRGIKDGSGLYIIRKTSMPAVLLEGGFMDSVIDIKKLRDVSVLEEAGKQIAIGVCEYFGIAFKEEKTAPLTPKSKHYRVQVGYYSDRKNAEKMLEDLKKHGFDGVIKEE